MTETLQDQHLVREWEQAWNHYRHLESTRSQYLGFFFTVLVVSIGLSVGLMKDVKSDEKAAVLFGLAVLAFIDFLITLGLFTAIKKIGYVLQLYETILNTVRQKAGFCSSEELPFNLADMKHYPRDVLDAGLFSVQRSAEIILGAASALFVALLATLATFFFDSAIPFEPWHKGLGVGIAGCATFYLLAVFLPLARAAICRGDQNQQDPGDRRS